MTEFKSSQDVVGKKLKVTFEGSIDEGARLPELTTNGIEKIVIDLNGVRAINSIGIREWLTWIRPLAAKVEIVFERCPKSIILQFNMVEGFLPKNASVNSFYVPFSCDKCGYEGSHLYNVGSEVQVANKTVHLTVDAKALARCSQNPCEIEMDVLEAKYFQFLKRN